MEHYTINSENILNLCVSICFKFVLLNNENGGRESGSQTHTQREGGKQESERESLFINI